MNGYDETASILSLTKQLLQQCDGEPDRIIIEKATLRLILTAFIQQWSGDQERKRQEYKKAAVNG